MSRYFKFYHFWQQRLLNQIVNLYAPWILVPTWNEFGNSLEYQRVRRLLKADYILRRYINSFFEVISCCPTTLIIVENEGKVPKISLYNNGKKITDYKDEKIFDHLQTFVKQTPHLDNTNKNTANQNESYTNSMNIIQNGVTIVKFYSPTCPHCMGFAPVWDQLESKYATKPHIQFSAVDCTQGELCEKQGVDGVPTLHIYKNGKKVDEYTDGWSYPEVYSFVKKYLE